MLTYFRQCRYGTIERLAYVDDFGPADCLKQYRLKYERYLTAEVYIHYFCTVEKTTA